MTSSCIPQLPNMTTIFAGISVKQQMKTASRVNRCSCGLQGDLAFIKLIDAKCNRVNAGVIRSIMDIKIILQIIRKFIEVTAAILW